MRIDFLETTVRTRRPPFPIQEYVRALDDAVRDHAFDEATRLVNLEKLASKNTSSQWVKANVAPRLQKARDLSAWQKRIDETLERLSKDPEDAGANLAMGRFLCFFADNWERGLPHLARGPDSPLKELAVRDLAGAKKVSGQIALGDACSDFAEKCEEAEQDALRMRAHHWYVEAFRRLPKDARSSVEERLRRAPRRSLSDMTEYDVTVGFGAFGKDGWLGYHDDLGGRIVVNGVAALHGISMHPAAWVKYRLGRGYRRLETFVAINDTANPKIQRGSALFVVLGDGKKLWQSNPLRGRGIHRACEVDVEGVNELELRVNTIGGGHSLHAVWLDPVLVR